MSVVSGAAGVVFCNCSVVYPWNPFTGGRFHGRRKKVHQGPQKIHALFKNTFAKSVTILQKRQTFEFLTVMWRCMFQQNRCMFQPKRCMPLESTAWRGIPSARKKIHFPWSKVHALFSLQLLRGVCDSRVHPSKKKVSKIRIARRLYQDSVKSGLN